MIAPQGTEASTPMMSLILATPEPQPTRGWTAQPATPPNLVLNPE